jgi:hypothetical protein
MPRIHSMEVAENEITKDGLAQKSKGFVQIGVRVTTELVERAV